MRVIQWYIRDGVECTHEIECTSVDYHDHAVIVHAAHGNTIILPYATSLRIVIQDD